MKDAHVLDFMRYEVVLVGTSVSDHAGDVMPEDAQFVGYNFSGWDAFVGTLDCFAGNGGSDDEDEQHDDSDSGSEYPSFC